MVVNYSGSMSRIINVMFDILGVLSLRTTFSQIPELCGDYVNQISCAEYFHLYDQSRNKEC